MTPRRAIWLLIAVLCLGAFAASMLGLTARIRDYNTRADRAMYAFNTVNDRMFRFAGRDVSLLDEAKDGQEVVVVRFGDKETRLVPSVEPKNAQIPGLKRHADWLKVVRFTEYKGASRQEFQQHLNEGNDRLVIVTRRPRAAADPRTGEVWQRDWVFEFNEFLPSGEIQSRTLRYPRTKGDKQPKPDELRVNTWEMDAAMSLMPQNPPDSLNFGRPTTVFREDALRHAGWTMPAAVVSALGVMAALAAAFAPQRRARRAPDA